MPTQMPSSQMAPQSMPLPELPPGPSFENLRGPITEPLFETWQIVSVTIVAVMLLGYFACIIANYLRFRNAERSRRPPEEQAELSIQEAQCLADDRDFASAHSSALRDYLDDVLALSVKGQTSSELSRAMTLQLPVNGQRLNAFLETCDRVKFAGASLSEGQRIELSDTAKEIISSTEESRLKALEARKEVSK